MSVITIDAGQTKSHRTKNGEIGNTYKFPPRPDASDLNAAIPLFYIGQNRKGAWVVREAEGRSGGLFLLMPIQSLRSIMWSARRRSSQTSWRRLFRYGEKLPLLCRAISQLNAAIRRQSSENCSAGVIRCRRRTTTICRPSARRIARILANQDPSCLSVSGSAIGSALPVPTSRSFSAGGSTLFHQPPPSA
jgi:hypothetical protein